MTNAWHTPDGALQLLIEGNTRFASGHPHHPRQDAAARATLLNGQTPHTCVISCADSRVPPEILFDQGFGDMFVVRNGGHIPTDVVIASAEFAHVVAKCSLIVVLGHEGCKALEFARVIRAGEDVDLPGSTSVLTNGVIADLVNDDGSLFPTVSRIVDRLRGSQVITKAEKAGKIRVLGAGYHLHSGLVEWL
ncbi:carbonic anhydrase [Bowdeniella nasicola]|uniref:carbonic anhydrase n=1 Tax=Bowdeniella nasicola TaxID=208480 RepID=A0A1H4A2I8_9ACTO|nr:carbonic anhydrase [Bowdeniella nasicola]SEA30353.1 carbonic anhydrase [Bowdeniella nasicola]